METAAAAVPLERPDEVAARVTARVAKRRVEVMNLRTESSQTFANPDGTMTSERSARPVRVRKADGSWTPVDTTLKIAADGSVVPGATSVGLRFSGGKGALATISDAGKSLSVSWPTALPVPALDGDTATYAEVLPGVDLRVRADVDGFAEVLVVKTREAGANPQLAKLRFALAGTGVTAKADAEGDLQAVDGQGRPVFLGPAPRMWDSSTLAPSSEVTTRSATTDVDSGAEGPGESGRQAPMQTRVVDGALEVTPDAAVLTSPSTEFPVFLDPGFSSARVNWTMIDSGFPTTSYWNSSDVAKVGTYDSGAHKLRSFFAMNTNGLQGKHILSATFTAQLQYSWSCTAKPVELWATGGIGSGTTWNNPPSLQTLVGTVTTAKGFSGSCPAGPVSWNATSALQTAANGNASVFYLGLKSPSETDNFQWKKFANNPTMAVTYNTSPSGPSSFSINPCYAQCPSKTWVSDKRPTFKAKVLDPDAGQKARLDFEVYFGSTLVQQGSTPWGTSGQVLEWRATADIPVWSTHTVRVRGYDGTDYGPWSTSPQFWVDPTPPGPAAVASTDYPAGEWSKGAGQSGVVTLTAPGVTDLAGFAYGLDQNPPLNDVRATTSASVTVTPPTDGPHSLFVQSRDLAGNRGPLVEHKFFVGNGAVTTPTTGAVLANKTGLTVVAPPDITGATYQWRRGDADTWTDIPTGDVSPASGGGTVTWPQARSGADFPKLNWDVAKTVNDAEDGDEPLDGPLQVRAAFTGGPAGASNPVRFTLDRDMGSAASESIGPGSVNLLTGNYTVSDTDASVDSFGSDLTVSRTFNTRDAAKADVSGLFGQGWTSGVAVEDADVDYTGLTVTGSLVQVGLPDGESIGFTKNANGSYTPEIGVEDLTLTYTAATSTYTVTDLDGTVVTFTTPTGSAEFKPTAVTTPGSNQTTTTAWETVTVNGAAVTRPTRMLAPVPAGVTCGAGTAGLARGCRALSFEYSAGTVAPPAAGQVGDYPHRVKTVSITAWDPDAAPAAMTTSILTRYAYDSDGRLSQVWDPRLDYTDAGVTRHLADRYDYNGDGILTAITAAAEEPWQLTYTTVPGDSGKGRLAQVTRSALTAGTAKTTVVYRTPVSGTGAPYDLSEGQTKRWAQNEAPTDATAVFPADQVPGGDQAAGELPSNWDRATVSYLNANGQQVNTAAPGGGITTSIYDVYGNEIRSLTAANRKRALDGSDSDDAAAEAALAATLSTLNAYSTDGQLLTDTFGPEHDVAIPDGTVVRGREHTDYSYDQGAPGTGGPYRLVTTKVESVRYWTGTGPVDADTRATTTAYDWTLRQPTAVTTDPVGLNQTTRTSYDTATGLVLSTTAPAGGTSTNTPATRATTYYTAAANGTYPECGNRPEWANLACRSAPGGQPAGTPLPITVTTYDLFNQPGVITEKTPAGAVLRTSTTTYDSAGRAAQSQTVGAAGTGEPLPATKTVYEPATGRATRVQSLDSGGAVTAEIVKTFDTLGRQTSYTDADGNTSTISYDLLSRPATTADGKGTQTLTYDGGTERRGLLTQVVDSQAGTFTASYDTDGALREQTLPNGLQTSTVTDETGTATELTYTQPGCGADSCVLLTDAVTENIHGQWTARSSTLSAQAYTYDTAGRLTAVADTVEGQCATRGYAFSTATNRTGLSSYAPGTAGACQTSTAASTTSWTYDTADRITTTGHVHDTLGRSTTVPAADTQNPAGGDLTASYHVTDLVRSMAQNGRTTTYTLDVGDGRVRSWTDNDGTTTTTKKHHYDGDGDSPAWTDEGNSQYTRVVSSLGGDVTAIRGTDGTVEFQLANLHGDIAATTAADLATQPGLLTTSDTTEYGTPRDTTTIGTRRYGWLGAKQRAGDTPSGVALMGVRLYNPATGRFLTVDPVYGGSANDYDYCNGDPVNCTDLDGRMMCRDCGGAGGGSGFAWPRYGLWGRPANPLKRYPGYRVPQQGKASTHRGGNAYRGRSWGYEIQYMKRGGGWDTYKYGITSQANPRWRANQSRRQCSRDRSVRSGRCRIAYYRRFPDRYKARYWEWRSCRDYVHEFGRRPIGMRRGCR